MLSTLLENQEQISTVFRIHLDFLGRNQIDSFSQRYIQPIYSGHFISLSDFARRSCLWNQLRLSFSLFSILEEQSIYYDLLLKSKLYEFFYLLLSTGISIDTIQMIRIKISEIKRNDWLPLSNTMQSPFKLIILLQHLI